MPISRHQEDISDFHIRDLQMTLKVTQRQRSLCILLIGNDEHFVYRHLGLKTLYSIFTFETSNDPFKVIHGQFLRVLKDRYGLPNSV